MGKRLRTTLLYLVPFLVCSGAFASRALAQEGAPAPIHYVLSWEGLLGTVVYGAVGMVFAFLGYKIYDLITPFSLTKELEEDQNVSVGIVVGSVIIGVSIIMAAAISS